MNVINGIGQLTISFSPTAETGLAPAPLVLPDLVAVLDATQKAIYTAAAHARRLPGLRNLNDEERRQHTFALLGIRAGNLTFELLPLGAFVRETAPTLFPQDEMARITHDAAAPVMTVACAAVDALAAHFDETPAEHTSLSEQVSRYAATIAAVTVRSHQTVMLSATTGHGETTLAAGYETSLRVLMLAAVERGELQRYPGCVVRDVLASQSALYVEIPEYGNARVRCVYEGRPEAENAWGLHAGDEVTILGAPAWQRRQDKNGMPEHIKIAAILDAEGRIIGHPILHHLLKETASDLLTP